MLLAVEGPAGAGKSTWVAERYVEGTRVLERPLWPRSLSPGAGAWMSSAYEYTAIVAGTCEPAETFLVDRFLLSRWVYRSIQYNGSVLHGNWYAEMSRSLDRMQQMALLEANDRIGHVPLAIPQVQLTVLLPTLHQLETQRHRCGKQYPFPAYQELMLYGYITSTLLSAPLYGLNITVVGEL